MADIKVKVHNDDEIRAGIGNILIHNKGATFTPNVSEEGIISWTNDKGLENPKPVNIKGKDGPQISDETLTAENPLSGLGSSTLFANAIKKEKAAVR